MLLATIFRGGYDSRLNYFYGTERVLVAGINAPFTPQEGDKVGMLVKGYQEGNVIFVPAELIGGEWVAKRGGMAGGTFVHTSDSRFSDALEALVGYRFYGAVSVHDRFEN